MRSWKYAMAATALAGAVTLPTATAFADEEYIINRSYSYPVSETYYTERRVVARPVVREVHSYRPAATVVHREFVEPSVTVIRPGVKVECDDDGECEVDD